MAWTDPITWLADQLVEAADLNAQIRDNLDVLIVPIDTATGKITELSSSTLDDLSGANLTGVAKLASANVFTAKNSYNGGASSRLVLPVGSDKWGT